MVKTVFFLVTVVTPSFFYFKQLIIKRLTRYQSVTKVLPVLPIYPQQSRGLGNSGNGLVTENQCKKLIIKPVTTVTTVTRKK
jgi:hypothetical protein